ncbi:phage holin family protein [Prevotella corporis]|uniref:phage holin family protein n=1 Tax=Prevotella corporis TaxID=28128 RepID=UPI0023F39108|nr:phage holin family protein [Prevotella corporis]
MFSNDNNVETIAQLIEVAKHYIGLQSEYVKLDVIEKVVKILTAIALVSVFAGLLTISLIYLSFAAVYAMEPYIGSLAIAYLIVGFVYVVFIILFILLRHRLVERPLVKFLAGILMSK